MELGRSLSLKEYDAKYRTRLEKTLIYILESTLYPNDIYVGYTSVSLENAVNNILTSKFRKEWAEKTLDGGGDMRVTQVDTCESDPRIVKLHARKVLDHYIKMGRNSKNQKHAYSTAKKKKHRSKEHFEKPRKVYVLTSTVTPMEVYVGQTLRPLKYRLSQHINDLGKLKGSKKKQEWYKRIIESDGEIKISLLEECGNDHISREWTWINSYKENGFTLINAGH